MAVADEDALICDFAETYGVYDYRSLPLLTAATFAQGLGLHSRVMRKLLGAPFWQDTYLLAAISDQLGHLIWMLSDDGLKGRNHPTGFLQRLGGDSAKKDYRTYDGGDAFRAAWRELTKG